MEKQKPVETCPFYYQTEAEDGSAIFEAVERGEGLSLLCALISRGASGMPRDRRKDKPSSSQREAQGPVAQPEILLDSDVSRGTRLG